jgi:sulfur relay (sulfurtransferase) DsrF/TusC family protein
MKKSHLYLVSTKAVIKKYDMFYVYMCDESVFEFKLNEYRVCRDEDFIEVTSIDNTIMELFSLHNLMRVKFVKSTVKLVGVETSPPVLKPVA